MIISGTIVIIIILLELFVFYIFAYIVSRYHHKKFEKNLNKINNKHITSHDWELPNKFLDKLVFRYNNFYLRCSNCGTSWCELDEPMGYTSAPIFTCGQILSKGILD